MLFLNYSLCSLISVLFFWKVCLLMSTELIFFSFFFPFYIFCHFNLFLYSGGIVSFFSFSIYIDFVFIFSYFIFYECFLILWLLLSYRGIFYFFWISLRMLAIICFWTFNYFSLLSHQYVIFVFLFFLAFVLFIILSVYRLQIFMNEGLNGLM